MDSLPDSAPAVDAETLLRHARFVRKVAIGIAREADADDLVQEAWLAALRRPPRSGTNLRGWFRRVVQGQAFNARASERARCDHESRAGAHDKDRTPRRKEHPQDPARARAVRGRGTVLHFPCALAPKTRG